MPPISVLIKPASSLCNMACDYCFYKDEAVKRSCESYGLMSEDTLKNVIRKTMCQAEHYITYAFQGGEPTLCGIPFFQHAIELQKHYNRNHIRVQNSLQTNGLNIDDDWCRFFKENNFLIGISVDGTKELHNSVRHSSDGGDTYDRVFQAIRLLEKYQVEYNILTVVTSDITKNIEEIYKNYAENHWYYQQYIACLDPLGEGHGTTEYSLTPEDYGEFLVKLFRLWYKDLKKGKQPYIRQFDNYVGIAAGYMAEACDQRGRCGIQYVIEADGSVYPCDFYVLDEYRLGNFNTQRLADIDVKRTELQFIERSGELADDCKKCEYYFICRGGCQRNRDWNEQLNCYTNYFCRSYKTFFGECLPAIKEIADELKRK